MLKRPELDAKIADYEKELRAALKPQGFTTRKAFSKIFIEQEGSAGVEGEFNGYGRSGFSSLHESTYKCVQFKIIPRYRRHAFNQPQVFREKKDQGGKLDMPAIVAAIVASAKRRKEEDSQEEAKKKSERSYRRRADALAKKAPGSVNVSSDEYGVHLDVRDVTEAQALAIFTIVEGV